ncbi:helix-turn-helix transcriptional regulator [Flavobacteriaceae bacterium GSB9]|nr:helix-turn-helix transcriptional regulator [Flavobacteriaceae bacterium GSB9]
MFSRPKILFVVFSLVVIFNGFSATPSLYQIDSLIHEKNMSHDMTKLDLLVLYEEALIEGSKDSLNIFKDLALLNAELEQPEDAYSYTKKYIDNTLDFSILNNGVYENISGTVSYKKLKDKYITNVDVLAFIYFYVALIGFFFMITINFTKKANTFAKFFIAGFVGAHSLFVLEFVLYMTNIQYQFAFTYRMSAAAALLYGPLLYFYFKSVTEKFQFKTKYILHFLPTILLLLFLSPVYMATSSEKVRMMLGIHATYKTYDIVVFVTKIVSLLAYVYFTGKLLKSNTDKDTSDTKVLQKNRWKRYVYKIHIVYVLSYLLYGISVFGALGSVSSFIYHVQIGVMSVMIIYIAYMAYVQPSIFDNEIALLKGKLFPEKYQKSGLTDGLSKELSENLIKLMVEEKVYKENNISLEILADKLNTTRHNTSQIINENFNMNFFELINKFRIQEAVNLFILDVNGNLNIIDVAYEVGYNNKVTFNKAFKKEMELTPSEFINSKKKQTVKVNIR